VTFHSIKHLPDRDDLVTRTERDQIAVDSMRYSQIMKGPKIVLHNDNLPPVKSENDQLNHLQHNSALCPVTESYFAAIP